MNISLPSSGKIPDDEWNLLYVAVTRAKTSLIITKTIRRILTVAGVSHNHTAPIISYVYMFKFTFMSVIVSERKKKKVLHAAFALHHNLLITRMFQSKCRNWNWYCVSDFRTVFTHEIFISVFRDFSIFVTLSSTLS